MPGPDLDWAREAVQGLVDPSPELSPLHLPRQRGPLGPEASSGASSRQCPGWRFASLGGGRTAAGRGAGALLGCSPTRVPGWAPRRGRRASSLRRGHGRASSARAGNPTRVPQPHTPHGGAGGGDEQGEGEEVGWWVRGCGDPWAECPARQRCFGAASRGPREEPAPYLAGVEPAAGGSPGAAQAWLGEADPRCCLHFVSCLARSVVVVVWVWGAAEQGVHLPPRLLGV